MRVWLLVAALAAIFGATAAGPVRASPPTVRLESAPLVSPTTAWLKYGALVTHATGAGAWATSPPEIAALARTLGANRLSAQAYAQNVRDYVRNNIAVEFRFGLGKGGRGALIDQSGTPFDQADLMVKLLREGGVSASYQVGTITLSPSELGHWTGLVRGLTSATSNSNPYANRQSFGVDARSACQFLADGGIPAVFPNVTSCAELSGNLTGDVTLGHIWVVANGQTYDPSLKLHRLFARQNVPSLMECGSWGASTCAQSTAAAVGAAGTFGGATAYNWADPGGTITTANNALNELAKKLQHAIEGQDPNLPVVELLGGKALYSPSTAASVPATYNGQGSPWAEVPDQYRTRFTVYPPHNAKFVFYADEIAGRRLTVLGIGGDANVFLVDGVQTAGSFCDATCSSPSGEFRIEVDHPYAANEKSYADRSLSFPMVEAPGVNSNLLYGTADYGPEGSGVGSFPVEIVHGFGSGSTSSQQHMSLLQGAIPEVTPENAACMPSTTVQVVPGGCAFGNGAVQAETIRAYANLMDQIVSGVTDTAIARHHDVGIVYSSRKQGGTYLSVQSAMSATANRSEDTTAAQRAFALSAHALPDLELAATYSWAPDSVSRAGPALTTQVLDVAPGQMAGVIAALPAVTTLPSTQQAFEVRRRTLLQAAADAGYSTVMPTEGSCCTGELFYKPGDLGYTLWQSVKGGGVADPASRAMKTVQAQSPSDTRRRYYSVSPADGDLTIEAPADIVTGAGDFPYSLPFVRSYSAGATERLDTYKIVTAIGGPPTARLNRTWQYGGADGDMTARLGGGWIHNYNISVSSGSDAARSLGYQNALEASAAIARAVALSEVAASSQPVDHMRMLLISTGSSSGGWTVTKGLAKETFIPLPDGRYSPPPGSTAKLEVSVPFPTLITGVAFTYTGPAGDKIAFDRTTRYTSTPCDPPGFRDHFVAPIYRATSWTFPDGVRIDFDYDLANFWSSVPETLDNCSTSSAYVLHRVRNNLGRSLTFTVEPYTAGVNTFYNDGGAVGNLGLPVGYKITAVTDETGRAAHFATSCAVLLCDAFTATNPNNDATRYEYGPDAASPDPGTRVRPAYRLRRVFTAAQPSASAATVAYDPLFRVKSVADALSHATQYFPGGAVGAEPWKRTEIVSPIGATSITVFDDHNRPVSAKDALGHETVTVYDRAGRPVRVVQPEKNAEERTYDVRGNQLSTCLIPKTRQGQACDQQAGDILTRTSYREGATTIICAYQASCNKPATETDAKLKVTDYTWESETGLLLRIQSPADENNVRPQIDLGYVDYAASVGSLRLLDTRIEQIRSGLSTTTKYAYDTSNKFVLLSSTVDQGGLDIPTGYGFDAVGNLTSVDGPLSGSADTTLYAWDPARRLRQTSGPAAGGGSRPATRIDFNGDDQITGVAKGVSTTGAIGDFTVREHAGYDYDVAGRRLRDTVYNGASTTAVAITDRSFDAADRLDCTTIRMKIATAGLADGGACDLRSPSDRITRNHYTAIDQVERVEKGLGTSARIDYVRTGYTDNGKPQWVADARGNRTGMTYDGFDRLIRQDFPETNIGNRAADAIGLSNTADYEVYGYDLNGNRDSFRRRNGLSITYKFDALNRMTEKHLAGDAGHDVYYAYDLVGRMTEARFGSHAGLGSILTYDAAGRLRNDTTFSRAVDSDYDKASNRTRVSAGGLAVLYDYDGVGRLTGVREDGAAACAAEGARAATFSALACIDYDDMGRRRHIDRGNGGAADYTYDGAGRLASLGQRGRAAILRSVQTISYNPAAQIQSQSQTDNGYVWRGKPVVPDRAYDGLNRDAALVLLDTSQGYDDNKNVRLDGVRKFEYDLENRLIRVRPWPATAGPSVDLAYDPLGRLSKMTTAPGTAIEAVTLFQYDGERLVVELAGDGTPLRKYVHGPGVDEPLVWFDGATKRWLHADRQGSIIASSDPQGDVTPYSYGPWGEPSDWGAMRFRYTGQIALQEAQLYHYKARVYDPMIGRFLQTDPVGYDGGDLNLYAYVNDDPTNKTDATGLFPDGEYHPYLATREERDAYWGGYAIGGAVGAGIDVLGIGALLAPGAVAWALANPATTAEVLGVAGEAVAPGAGLATGAGVAVRAYESGAANELRAASRVGDNLDIHHAPQAHAAEHVIPNYNRHDGPAIALPKGEHARIPNARGGVTGSPRSLLAETTRNLRNYTNASNAEIQEWLKKAKRYVGMN